MHHPADKSLSFGRLAHNALDDKPQKERLGLPSRFFRLDGNSVHAFRLFRAIGQNRVEGSVIRKLRAIAQIINCQERRVAEVRVRCKMLFFLAHKSASPKAKDVVMSHKRGALPIRLGRLVSQRDIVRLNVFKPEPDELVRLTIEVALVDIRAVLSGDCGRNRKRESERGKLFTLEFASRTRNRHESDNRREKRDRRTNEKS